MHFEWKTKKIVLLIIWKNDFFLSHLRFVAKFLSMCNTFFFSYLLTRFGCSVSFIFSFCIDWWFSKCVNVEIDPISRNWRFIGNVWAIVVLRTQTLNESIKNEHINIASYHKCTPKSCYPFYRFHSSSSGSTTAI